MEMNSLMRRKITADDFASKDLPDSLRKIVSEGFLKKDGCFLLKAFYDDEYDPRVGSQMDNTEYECFINHIHIGDFVKSYELSYAINYVRCIFLEWNKDIKPSTLTAIISLDEEAATVHLHTHHEGEAPRCEGLEDFEQEILVINSQEKNYGL